MTSAQNTKTMQEENNETVPQYYYTEKEIEKVTAYIEQQYGKAWVGGTRNGFPITGKDS